MLSKLQTSWSLVSLICLPFVESKTVLMEHLTCEEKKSLEKSFQYILTREDLENSKWLENSFEAGYAKKDEEESSSDADYLELLSVLIGSQYASFDIPLMNFKDNTAEHIVGTEGLCVHIGGGDEILSELEEVRLENLRGKPLGSILNIMFWNEKQRTVLDTIKTGQSLVIAGKDQ